MGPSGFVWIGAVHVIIENNLGNKYGVAHCNHTAKLGEYTSDGNPSFKDSNFLSL